MYKTRQKTPRLVLVLACLLFCYGFMLGGQQLVLAGICEQFGIGVVGMGTMVAVLHVSSTLAPALMGALADRTGKKSVLVTFAIVFGTGCLLAAFSGGIPLFVAAMLTIGAGYSVCESLTSAICVDVDVRNGARYVNLTQCLLSVGAIVAPMVMAKLPQLPFENWRLLYFLCGAALITTGIVLSCMAFPTGSTTQAAKTSAKALWRSPIFLALVISIFAYVGLENGFGYFLESLFDLKLSGAVFSAYGLSAYWAGMAISRFVYSLRAYRPRTAVRLSFLGTACAFTALVFVPSAAVCVVLCGMVGFSYGPIWTTLVAGAAERFPEHKASATGLMSASCGLGGIVYPMFMGILVDSLDIRIGFAILAVTAVLGAVLAFSLKNSIQEA